MNGVIARSESTSTRHLLDEPLRKCLRALLDSVGAYEAVRDSAGRIVDFDIVYVNEQGAAGAGITIDQQIGRRLCEVFPQVRSTGMFDRYCAVVETGTPLVEAAMQRRDRWSELRVSRLGDGFLAVWRDITERKRMEAELQRANALLNAVIEASPAAIFVKDLEGRYLLVNPVTQQNLGQSGEPVVGRIDRQLFSPEVLNDLIETDRRVATTGQTVTTEEVVDTIGGRRTFLSVKTPLRDDAGNIYAVCGVATDITNRIRAEEALRARVEELAVARAAAEAASRAKDEFLATVSHELRTPLTAVIGYLRMIQQGAVPPERLATVLETVNRNAHLQLQVIDDILDVSGITQGKMVLDVAPVRVAQALLDTLATVRPAAARKGVEVTQALPEADVIIMGDPRRLHQVFWNVLSNAVKFTPAGGRVDVTLEAPGDEVVVTVADTGVGIAPEFLPRIFDRFTQGTTGFTREQGGLGLGLAIVHHFVAGHGGTVTASSPGAGLGATFEIRLPGGVTPPCA